MYLQGAIQSLKPDQDSGAFKTDREDIQRTKASVLSPRAGGAGAAVVRHSRGSVLVQRLCATQPKPREGWCGLQPELLHCGRQQQLHRASASVEQLDVRLLSELPKQPVELSAAALKELLWDIWREEQAAPCHGLEAAPAQSPALHRQEMASPEASVPAPSWC